MVLCEIIERYEGKNIIVVVKNKYCRIIIQYASMNGVCMNECEIPYISYSDHLYLSLFLYYSF